jgi:hypothetical protein
MNGTDERYGVLATIPGGDERAEKWRLYFGGLYVPVISDEPRPTILPGGITTHCYFVDFSSCNWLLPRLRLVAVKQRNATILAMLARPIYPIAAERVTVMRAPIRLLSEMFHQ